MLERILKSDKFNLTQSDLDEILDTRKFVGRSPEQVVEFVEEEVKPFINQFDDWKSIQEEEIKV